MDDRRRSEIMASYRARAETFEALAQRTPDSVPEARAAPPRRRRTPLSPRELETLSLVAEGLSNREIGNRLFLTEETIKNHVANVLAKLDASNRAHAVAIGMARGLIALDAHA